MLYGKKVSWYHYFISIDIVKSFFDCEVCVMGAKKRLPVGIEFFDELITESSEGKLINALKEFAYRRIYCHSSILKLELMGNEILSFLLDRFVDALLPYDTDIEITEIQKKYIDLLSQNYLEQYHETAKTVKSEEDKVYARLLLATDFIAGMTDSYAKRLYQELRGI